MEAREESRQKCSSVSPKRDGGHVFVFCKLFWPMVGAKAGGFPGSLFAGSWNQDAALSFCLSIVKILGWSFRMGVLQQYLQPRRRFGDKEQRQEDSRAG